MSRVTFTRSASGTPSNPKPEEEIIMGSGMSKEDLDVTSIWLNELAGAAPAIGYNQSNNTWVVAPTCKCQNCREFTEQYQLVWASNPLRAVRLYLDALNAYEALAAKSKGLH